MGGRFACHIEFCEAMAPLLPHEMEHIRKVYDEAPGAFGEGYSPGSEFPQDAEFEQQKLRFYSREEELVVYLPAKEIKTWGILTKLTFHQQKTELQPANMIQNVGDFHWGIYFLPLEMIVFDIQQTLGWYLYMYVHSCSFMQYGWYPIYNYIYIHYIYISIYIYGIIIYIYIYIIYYQYIFDICHFRRFPTGSPRGE